MTSRSSIAYLGQAGEPELSALHSSRYIGGLTHEFYRYPAAASPELVREILLSHTDLNDVVLDPFMGGGTTIVEAIAHGRRAVGSDLNSLAVFVTRVKTTPLSDEEWDGVLRWGKRQPFRSGVEATVAVNGSLKLPRALSGRLGRALTRTASLRTARQEAVVRCALLRTAQWALESSYLYPRREDDRRNSTPSLARFDVKLLSILEEMRSGMADLVGQAHEHAIRKWDVTTRRLLLSRPAEELRPAGRASAYRRKVSLVLTSPPYPNVHVLYHRWQVEGRRETPAPYWIAGQSDGATLSYYIMGSRTPHGQRRYFERLEHAFAAVRPFLRRDAQVMQLVAFNDAEEQLPYYLRAMERAGYKAAHGRRRPPLIRDVPNRRWYARGKDFDAGREYLLIHTPNS